MLLAVLGMLFGSSGSTEEEAVPLPREEAAA